ncbi:MAG: cytochrome c4 [Methylococcaceae bacterium]|nr:cytochrome c4 [Methylococcaceae bacterium]
MSFFRIAAGLICAALLSPAARSAERPPESPEAIKQRIGSGDPLAGKAKSEAELCQGCHGENGGSIAVGVPNLAGQYAAYIAKQLQDFRSGARRHRIMTAMSEGVSETDSNDIAAYFASQPPMQGVAGEANAAARELFLYGDVDRNLDACVSCHEPSGGGKLAAGVAYPRLAGQAKGYLRVQLLNWKINARSNSPQGVMNRVAGALTEQEIAALANYLSGI